MINKLLDYMRYGKMENTINTNDYIEFKNDDDAEAWGNKYYGEWSQKYKTNMKIAGRVVTNSCMTGSIECYCGDCFRQINKYLRYNIYDSEEQHLYREMSDILTITLSMAPRIPDNVVAYRLVYDEFIEELVKNNKEGSPTPEKGFISTSLTVDIVNSTEYYSDCKNMLKIYVKANTIGIYVNGVTKRDENELLLYPGGYFKLIKKPYIGNNKVIYECELMYFSYI